MTTKIHADTGIEFPDSTVQSSAAYTKAQSDGPAFSVNFTGTSISPQVFTALVASEKLFDTNSAYSVATGRFTPQVAGYYQINASVAAVESVSGLAAAISKNDALVVGIAQAGVATPSPFQSLNVSSVVFLNGSTDYVLVKGYSESGSFTATGKFSGALVRHT